MQGNKVQFTATVFCMWLYQVRKSDGLNCSSGSRPLWEAPTKRCTFHFNWDCSLSEGEAFLSKTWIKDDNDIIAQRALTSNFTAKNGFDGRLEQYNENGLILKDLTTKDAGYYKLVVTYKTKNSSILEENTSSIYLPSIPSCEADLGSNTIPFTGKNDTSHISMCDGGHIPALYIGLLPVLGIMTIVLLLINGYLCRKYKLSQNDLRNTQNGRREELNPLSSYPALHDVQCDI